MTHNEQKIDAYRAWMLTQQVRPGTSTPPLWRLLWKLGVPLAPPHFLGFFPLLLVCGTFFGPIWGLTMYLLVWRNQGMPLQNVFGATLLAGLLFGLAMAWVYRRKARQLKLPSWQDWRAPH